MFSFKKAISSSDILQDWTDWHSHILPGVDDGISDMEEALEVLKFYETHGIKEVWLTPHIMEEIPNTPELLREKYNELREAAKDINIKLNLAAEHMIDALFVQRLNSGEVMPYGKGGDMLLVETSYADAPMDFKKILEMVKAKGYHPVLAHPERYLYMDEDDYDQLKEMGVRFQLNLVSLAGAYGREAQENAEYLLEIDYYDLTGSDIHRLTSFSKAIEKKALKKSTMTKLKNIILI